MQSERSGTVRILCIKNISSDHTPLQPKRPMHNRCFGIPRQLLGKMLTSRLEVQSAGENRLPGMFDHLDSLILPNKLCGILFPSGLELM